MDGPTALDVCDDEIPLCPELRVPYRGAPSFEPVPPRRNASPHAGACSGAASRAADSFLRIGRPHRRSGHSVHHQPSSLHGDFDGHGFYVVDHRHPPSQPSGSGSPSVHGHSSARGYRERSLFLGDLDERRGARDCRSAAVLCT